ncbi:alpha/beta fold hydrolase [Paractinoplanes globisporus]|uniref:Alpha/beta fold hydrolase n=1 Tax=Paractinoplanes globisporus TaxID=113565 RepID=A0ABW6WTX6_9ACTN|nr:alpha/beta hydrolase [Actinoplanes globisporus]
MTFQVAPGVRPPIVFVSALGTRSENWDGVRDRLKDLETIAYDRPGIGGVPARPAPNPPLSYRGFADELVRLLDDNGVTGPVVLVGHSFGALIVRALAGAHPRRVAGLVIVDGALPQFHLEPSDEPMLDGDEPGATELDIVTGNVEVLSASVPAVPAAVLVRTHGKRNSGPPPHPAAEDLWRVSQRRLAGEMGTPLIVADDSAHFLQREAPDLVAYAVRLVHAAVRDSGEVRVRADDLAPLKGHLDR